MLSQAEYAERAKLVEKLKTALKAVGLNQKVFAQAAGLPESSLSNWMRMRGYYGNVRAVVEKFLAEVSSSKTPQEAAKKCNRCLI